MAMAMIDFNLVGDHGRMWSLFSFTCFHISMSSSLLERSSNKSLTSGPQRVFPFFLTAQKRLRRCSMAALERTLPLHTRRPFSSMVTSSSSSVLQSVLNNKISISKEIVWNLSRIYHNDKKSQQQHHCIQFKAMKYTHQMVRVHVKKIQYEEQLQWIAVLQVAWPAWSSSGSADWDGCGGEGVPEDCIAAGRGEGVDNPGSPIDPLWLALISSAFLRWRASNPWISTMRLSFDLVSQGTWWEKNVSSHYQLLRSRGLWVYE